MGSKILTCKILGQPENRLGYIHRITEVRKNWPQITSARMVSHVDTA